MMNINKNLPPYKPQNFTCQKSEPINFTGHLGSEKYTKNGIQKLIHETAFFRESKTMEFVRNYILKNFANKEKINIIVGGCSSGEECISYSMLLNALKDKINILGFDLSSKSIEQAKSRKYLFQRPIYNTDEDIVFLTSHYTAFDDAYLAFTSPRPLNIKEREYKSLFYEFFDVLNSTREKEKCSLKQKILNWFIKKRYGTCTLEVESKIIPLKSGKADNCRFIQADIMDIENITGKDKADVITFSNSIYHLVTAEIPGILRYQVKDSEEILTKLIQRIKNSLNPNGIFVIGKDEHLQSMDSQNLIQKLLKKFGFRPLNNSDDSKATVWQRGRGKA